MQAFGLQPSDAVMLDDLLPGVEMARAAGIAGSIGAGWGHRVPAIEAAMRAECTAGFFLSVEAFASFLLDDHGHVGMAKL